jgi:hypothetical protein
MPGRCRCRVEGEGSWQALQSVLLGQRRIVVSAWMAGLLRSFIRHRREGE